MDEKQARQRLVEGGYFVALEVPPGVDFGVDLKSYKVGGIGYQPWIGLNGRTADELQLVAVLPINPAHDREVGACGQCWVLRSTFVLACL